MAVAALTDEDIKAIVQLSKDERIAERVGEVLFCGGGGGGIDGSCHSGDGGGGSAHFLNKALCAFYSYTIHYIAF